MPMIDEPRPARKLLTRKYYKLQVWGTLAVITTVAGVLQLHGIAAKSLWLDEGASISLVHLDWYDFVRVLWRRELNMVLYYVFLREWIHWGDSVAFLRGLSVLFAVAAVPAIFFLGRRMYGTNVGLVSALLLSVNAFQVRYAQEVRSYSLLALLVILSSTCYVAAARSGHRRNWNLYIAATVLSIYAHFFAVLVVVSQIAALFSINYCRATDTNIANTKSWPEFRRALLLIALLTLPSWIFIATTGPEPVTWIPRLRAGDILHVLRAISGNANSILLALYAVCVLVGVLTVFRGDSSQPDRRCYTVVVACWFFVPLLVILAVSVLRPMFVPRYLIICLPAWVLLAAVGVTSLRPRLLRGVVLMMTVWLAVNGVRSYYKADFDIGRNDVRSATAYILNHSLPGDGILFDIPPTRFPFEYYAAHSSAKNKPDMIWVESDSVMTWRDFLGYRPSTERIAEFTANHSRLWVLGLPEFKPPDSTQLAFRLVDKQEFPYIRVYLYER